VSAGLRELVRLEHVLVGVDDADAAAVIRRLSEVLLASGTVTNAHADAVVARERTDPTGLPTAGAGVAIPHGDPATVREAAIAIAVPTRPIPFGQLGDPEVVVDAEVVFLLALTDADGQLAALREVAELVQDPDRLRGLTSATTPDDVVATITDHLEGRAP
jgi:PTS system galactitol-specific IIA component